MLAHCLQVAGKRGGRNFVAFEGLQFAPPTGEHCCEIGEYFYEKGQWEQAIFWYENALHAERCTEQGAFVQEECYGFLPCIRLCVCYGRLGEWEMAKMYNEMAGVFRPEDASVRQNRGVSCEKGIKKQPQGRLRLQACESTRRKKKEGNLIMSRMVRFVYDGSFLFRVQGHCNTSKKEM